MKYRVTKRPHYINDRIHKPGEIVTLPEGVKPGKLLEPLEGPKPAAEAAAPKGKGGRKPAAEAA